MERIIVVDKLQYVAFAEMLNADERISAVPPPNLWTEELRERHDERFPSGLTFQINTPEGVRWFWLMKGK